MPTLPKNPIRPLDWVFISMCNTIPNSSTSNLTRTNSNYRIVAFLNPSYTEIAALNIKIIIAPPITHMFN